jgi:hypothetical protein
MHAGLRDIGQELPDGLREDLGAGSVGAKILVHQQARPAHVEYDGQLLPGQAGIHACLAMLALDGGPELAETS